MEQLNYQKAFERCLTHLENTIREMPNPPAEYAACGDGYYFRNPPYLPFSHIGTWMTSFFTGEGLLAGHSTGEKRYLEWVEGFADAYEKKLEETPEDTMHDVGFLYVLYAVGLYRETGKACYRDMGIRAAEVLLERFDPDAGLIRAWGRMDVKDHHSAGLAIIDCMMNLSLLFFAWKETGKDAFLKAAERHADTTAKCFIRPDGSVCHGYQYAEAAGVPEGEVNHCGFGVGSFWARGLAWAIFGYAVCHRYTKKPEYLETARRLADRFLAETAAEGQENPPGSHGKTTMIPPWDFRLPEGIEKLRDSSAAAVAACGFDEIFRACGESRYRESGKYILRELAADYENPDGNSSGILLYSNGKEHCTSFGDYFYMEALLRYGEGFEGYW